MLILKLIKILLWWYCLSFLLVPFILRGFCCIIGLRGSGKSNLASMLAWYWINIKHKDVYSNFPVRNCYEYDVSDLGTYMINNVILILDEAGIDMSNRKVLEKSMKGIKENNRKFWKLTRHYHIPNVYIFSQAKDYDILLRRLCDSQFIITNGWFGTSKLHFVKQFWKPSQEGDDITIGLEILKFPHLRVLRKHWFKHYDSFEVDILPYKEFNKYNFTSLPDPSIHRPRRITSLHKKIKKLVIPNKNTKIPKRNTKISKRNRQKRKNMI